MSGIGEFGRLGAALVAPALAAAGTTSRERICPARSRGGVPAGRIAADIDIDDGTDFIGRPPGWGRQQIEPWELTKYHQPSVRLDGSWSFDGMIEDAQLEMLSAWLIAQADALPAWNAGNGFEAPRRHALGALGGAH